MDDNPHLWEIRWVRDLILLLVAGFLLIVLYSVRAIVAPVVIALALAYIVNPLVLIAKSRLKISRLISTAIMMFLGLVATLAAMLLLVPGLSGQIHELIHAVPGYIETIQNYIDWEWARVSFDRYFSPPEANEGRSPVEAKDLQAIGATVLRVLGFGFHLIGSAINLTLYCCLAMVVIAFSFFFFCWKFDVILGWFDQFIPQLHRDRTLAILQRMDRAVSAFVRGRLIQALVMGLILSVGWWLAGVPYWLLLGLGTGLLNLVPFAGFIGFVVALGLMLVDHLASIGSANRAAEDQAILEYAQQLGIAVSGLTPQQEVLAVAAVTFVGFNFLVLVWPTVAYFVAQGFDGWVVEPLVQGKATDLDPLTVLLAVLIGGALAGLLGLILAIPATACIKILAEEVIIPHLRGIAAGQSR
jgi:predicted PurR-regulated permease PerM